MGFFKDSLAYRKKELAWQRQHEAAAPKMGDPAPDFKLLDATGSETITLSEFLPFTRGKTSLLLIIRK